MMSVEDFPSLSPLQMRIVILKCSRTYVKSFQFMKKFALQYVFLILNGF